MNVAMLLVTALTSSCDLDTLNFAIRSSRTLMDCAFSFLMFEESMAWTDGMVMEGRGRIEKRGERERCFEGGGVNCFLWVSKEFL